jgi:hypothetical protein
MLWGGKLFVGVGHTEVRYGMVEMLGEEFLLLQGIDGFFPISYSLV